ncbi:hypothetical protein D3C79_957050 [compost metagenome]
MAQACGRVLLVEIIALIALDPFVWVIAIEVQPRCLGGNLYANVQAQVFHTQVLHQMHSDVEQFARGSLADKLVEMLGFPVKHP